MERHFPTGKHKQVKGLVTIKWKPQLIPKISFRDADGNKLKTADTPGRKVTMTVSQQGSIEESSDEPGPDHHQYSSSMLDDSSQSESYYD